MTKKCTTASICFVFLVIRFSAAWPGVREFLYQLYLNTSGELFASNQLAFSIVIRACGYLGIFLFSLFSLYLLNRGYYYREHYGLMAYWRNYMLRLSGSALTTCTGLWALGSIVRILSNIPLH